MFYYFVAITEDLRIIFQAKNEEELAISSAKWKRKKIFLLIIFLIASTTILVSAFLYFFKYEGNIAYFLEIAAKIVILGIDLYSTYVLIRLLNFHESQRNIHYG